MGFLKTILILLTVALIVTNTVEKNEDPKEKNEDPKEKAVVMLLLLLYLIYLVLS